MADDFKISLKFEGDTRDVTKGLDSLKTSLNQTNKSLQDVSKSSEDLTNKIEESGNASKEATDSLQDQVQSFDDISEATKEAVQELEKFADQKKNIEEFGKSLDKLSSDFTKLGRNITALTAPLGLVIGVGLKNIFEFGKETNDTTNKTGEFANSLIVLKNSLVEVSTQIGERLLPVIQPLINFATNLVLKFNQLSDSTKDLIATIAGVATIIGPTLIVFGTLLGLGAKLAPIFAMIGSSISSLVGSLLSLNPLVLVFSSLIVIGSGLVNIFLKLKETGEDTFKALSSVMKLVAYTFLNYTVGMILDGFAALYNGIAKIAGKISDKLGSMFSLGANVASGFSKEISDKFKDVKGEIDSQLEKIGSSSGDAFTFGLKDSISQGLESLKGLFTKIDPRDMEKMFEDIGKRAGNLQKQFSELGLAIKTSMENNITDGLMNMIDGTKSVADAFADMTKQILRDITQIMIRQQVAGLLGKALPAFASGGLVTGRGTGTSDSITARLSNGEFVVRAAAVKKVGVNFLDYINSLGSGGRGFNYGTLSFANGGSIEPGQAGQQNISVEIINTGEDKQVSSADFDPESMIINVAIDDLNKGGKFSKAISNTFGVRRVGK